MHYVILNVIFLCLLWIDWWYWHVDVFPNFIRKTHTKWR